jgi:hypothetical protein
MEQNKLFFDPVNLLVWIIAHVNHPVSDQVGVMPIERHPI